MLPRKPAHASARKGRLVIAGSDPALRRRLLQSLGGDPSRKLCEVAARPDLQRHVAALAPSVILFDLGARPSGEALATVSALSALGKTIVLAAADDALAIQALNAGASGFCLRDTDASLVRKAVQLVEAGEIWVGRRIMLRLIEDLAALRAPDVRDVPGGKVLTRRERDIATLVAGGAGNKEIAQRLSISIKTVKAHLTNIFKKLELSTRLQLALALGPLPEPRTKVG